MEKTDKTIKIMVIVVLSLTIVILSWVIYAFVIPYFAYIAQSDSHTVIREDQGVQIQAIQWDNDTQTLTAYVQNVGSSAVELAKVYIDDVLDLNAKVYVPSTTTEDWVLPSGATRMIVSTGLYTGADNQVTVKVVTADGDIFILKKTVTYSSGSG